ncbi:hypothetical protein VB779_12695 [Haloarculaceae archaeon H-GB11]|nr:hypothetical protein [Haloarculaceae archaeon H-GB11]
MTNPVALSAELLRAVRYEEVTEGLESRLAGLDVGSWKPELRVMNHG